MMTPSAVVDSSIDDDGSVQSKRERMDSLFADGKRAYIVGDLTTASDKLGEASALAVELYGEFAVEAFYPHYYYGKTMLEIASVEDRVFTNALHNTATTGEDETEDEETEEQPNDEGIGNREQLTEDEREEIAEKVADALDENMVALEKGHLPIEATNVEDQDKHRAETASPMQRQKPDDNQEGEEDAKSKRDNQESKMNGSSVEENKDGVNEGGSEEAAMETEGGQRELGEGVEESMTEGEDDKVNGKDNGSDGEVGEGTVEEEEKREENVREEEIDKEEGEDTQDGDVECLQLAWEALEVARTICDKHIEEEGWEEKKANVLLSLVECSIENANYKQAMDDIDVCIELFKNVCKHTDRCIAEAYFQKARAYALDKQFENAADTYLTVRQLLENRLALMEKQLAEESDEGNKASIQKEVDGLKDLIPDVQLKIDDSRESAINAAKINCEKTAENTEELKDLRTVVSEGADDISGLVRKKAVKRPAEEEGPITDEQKKRAKCVVEEAVKKQGTIAEP